MQEKEGPLSPLKQLRQDGLPNGATRGQARGHRKAAVRSNRRSHLRVAGANVRDRAKVRRGATQALLCGGAPRKPRKAFYQETPYQESLPKPCSLEGLKALLTSKP